MAESGASYNNQFTTSRNIDEVHQYIVGAISGVDGCTVSMAGNHSIIVTRKYMPTWALAVGIIGLLCFLVGALAFLYRDTETLTIQLNVDQNGQTVGYVSGVASSTLSTRLNAVLTNL